MLPGRYQVCLVINREYIAAPFAGMRTKQCDPTYHSVGNNDTSGLIARDRLITGHPKTPQS
jgi:hypothetical protein